MKSKVMLSFFAISIALFAILSQTACTADKLPEPEPDEACDLLDATYDGAVKDIIDMTCAITGCHVNGGGGPGDYSNYSSMQPYLNDSEFREYVIVLRDDPTSGMPPDWVTNPGPKDLTQEQFDIIKCWVDADYPEN